MNGLVAIALFALPGPLSAGPAQADSVRQATVASDISHVPNHSSSLNPDRTPMTPSASDRTAAQIVYMS